jgi:hypothetical protein
MSNALALASVTAVLRNLLQNALIDQAVSAPLGGPVPVSALPPDRIKTGEPEVVQLNLFLYHVAPNPGWRNVALPSHDPRGQRLTNPPLALDLYYLLTAYSREDFEAEILLGYAMQVLHETPVLARDAIRSSLNPPAPGGGLAPAVAALAESDLAEQVELIKLIPQSLSTEEIYRLWGAFQTHYRPSVAYHASVVLIEANQPTRAPLPVLTRGQPNTATGREVGVMVQPSLLPPFPALLEAEPANEQTALRMGESLSCAGHHLDGDQVQVLFRHVRTARILELPASPGAAETEFQVPVPLDPPAAPVDSDSPVNPDNWQAGVYGVRARIQRAGKPDRLTNELPVALAPRVAVTAAVAGDDLSFTATVSPKVWRTQQASLIIAERELAAEPIAVDKTATLTFKAKTGELPSGPQWFRLRVDGIESMLVDRSGSLPRFDPTQQVTI